jgi:hypothetical protein
MRKPTRAKLDAIRAKARVYSSRGTDKRLTLREAACLLSSYHVEGIRYFLQEGVFGKPLRAAVRNYLFRRITSGELDHDRTEGSNVDRR